MAAMSHLARRGSRGAGSTGGAGCGRLWGPPGWRPGQRSLSGQSWVRGIRSGFGLGLACGFGLVSVDFAWIWVDLVDFGFWLSFARILLGFDLDLAEFRFDFGWIWLGF